MQKLPLKLRKNGFNYSQWLCCGDCYIYQQDYNSGINYKENDEPLDLKFYEVFRAKIRPAETIGGKPCPEREVYPSDEDFGKTAWAYRTFGEALNKLMKMKGHIK